MEQWVGTIIYMAFFIGIMYLVIFLPQKRRDKKTKEMLNSLQVGYDVTTIGGIIGKVVNIKDDEVTIESAAEKTQIKVKRWAVKDIDKPIEG